MTAAHESMSGIDVAWLRMERATNPMMVVSVLTLATPVSYARLRAVLEERLLRFARFKQRPVSDLAGMHWQDDPDFDLDAHFHRLALPVRGTKSHLEAAVSELASTALDARRPMWDVHLIEHYRKGAAVIARFHHCYADGMALLRVLVSLTDTMPDAATPKLDETHVSRPAALPIIGPALDMLQSLSGGAASLVSRSLQALTHPLETAALAKQASEATAELARIATLPDDQPTPLKGALGTRKHVAWAAPLSLMEAKTIARARGCTVNDVLLATVAGAFGRYLRSKGCEVDEPCIRALVPVNLRANGDEIRLGNRFGLVFAELPIREPDPLARLAAVHENMCALKESTQPMLTLWLLTGLGLLPDAIESQAIDLFTSKATLIISNVPGLQTPLYLAGARIEQQLFWVPQAGSIGIGVSLLTYNGHVNFGVMADRKIIANPQEVTRAFATEFESLLLSVISLTPPSCAGS